MLLSSVFYLVSRPSNSFSTKEREREREEGRGGGGEEKKLWWGVIGKLMLRNNGQCTAMGAISTANKTNIPGISIK